MEALMASLRCAASAICLLAAGCASTQTVTLPAPDPKDLATADAIIISSGGQGALPEPEGIVRGAGEGASLAIGDWAGGASVAPGTGDPGAAAAEVALALVALPVMAAIGASRAHSAEKLDAAKETFASVAGDPDLLPSLETRIANAIRQKARARWNCVAALKEEAESPCADAEAPARLEIEAAYAPWIKGRYDPEIAIAAMVKASLTAPSGTVHTMRWRYDSEQRGLFDLTANGGAPLREELKTMLDRLAETIARDMVVDPQPISAEVWTGGTEFEFTGFEYRQANAPTETTPGVVRRMHPSEPTPLALESALKAMIVGKWDHWLGACRIGEIDGTPPRPPLSNAPFLPGKSYIATADPGEHTFTIRCPALGEKNWAPREITATVSAGKVYCTDGKTFSERSGGERC